MSDQYFKDKAKEIEELINSDPKCSREQIRHLIYIALKEVARDQRYACVDAIGIDCNIDQREQDRLEMIIQNANIESKK